MQAARWDPKNSLCRTACYSTHCVRETRYRSRFGKLTASKQSRRCRRNNQCFLTGLTLPQKDLEGGNEQSVCERNARLGICCSTPGLRTALHRKEFGQDGNHGNGLHTRTLSRRVRRRPKAGRSVPAINRISNLRGGGTIFRPSQGRLRVNAPRRRLKTAAESGPPSADPEKRRHRQSAVEMRAPSCLPAPLPCRAH